MKFLGRDFKLKYPSCDDFVKLVAKKGKGCLIFKRDLTAAYRQFFMDPGDIHLLGYSIGKYLYFDVTLSMGSRSSCICCQLTTDTVTFIFKEKGFEDVNYLDDLGSAEIPQKAEIAYETLGKILSDIGIEESAKKACKPSKKCPFLGILYNTIEMQMQITPERLTEIRSIVNEWCLKESANLRGATNTG